MGKKPEDVMHSTQDAEITYFIKEFDEFTKDTANGRKQTADDREKMQRGSEA